MSGLHVRAFERVAPDQPGEWVVALWGEALGHIITLACGMAEGEALALAGSEAAERGLPLIKQGGNSAGGVPDGS